MFELKHGKALPVLLTTAALSFAGLSGSTYGNPGDETRSSEMSAPADDRDTSPMDTSSRQVSKTRELQKLTLEHDDLSTFVNVVEAAGMAEALTGDTAYTVFAPTNEAFEKSQDGADAALTEPGRRQELVALLRAHIVADDVDPEMAKKIGSARTVDGGTVKLESRDDTLAIGSATVVEGDIQVGSLRVYAIDGVLPVNAETKDSLAAKASLRDKGAEEEEAEE